MRRYWHLTEEEGQVKERVPGPDSGQEQVETVPDLERARGQVDLVELQVDWGQEPVEVGEVERSPVEVTERGPGPGPEVVEVADLRLNWMMRTNWRNWSLMTAWKTKAELVVEELMVVAKVEVKVLERGEVVNPNNP